LLTASVVVCTRDRPRDLRRALVSILRSGDAFLEIIVIDQGSTGRAERLVRLLQRIEPRLRYVRQEGRGVSRARNLAARCAAGDVIIFTDDDCEVQPGWARELVGAFERESGTGIAFGQVLPAEYGEHLGFVVGYRITRRRTLWGRLSKRLDGGIGANMAVSAAAFAAVGGFDEQLGPGAHFPSCEEGDLTYRMLHCANAAVHVPTSIVVHHGLRDWDTGRALVRDTYSGIAAAYFKHVRAGDPIAGSMILVELYHASAHSLGRILQWKRPLGLGRIAGLLAGIRRSFELPVDRKTGLYRPLPLKRPSAAEKAESAGPVAGEAPERTP
jgi:glycosyltransferase involved in cell wall biosynthesis